MGCCLSINSELENATFQNTPNEIYHFDRAKVVKVIDGDTFWIAGNHNGTITKFKMRLYGCDCPEIKTEEGKEVKNYVKSLLEDRIVSVSILNNKIYNGKKITEKYGRLIGFLFIKKLNLTDHLIERKKAVPYFGGTKSIS